MTEQDLSSLVMYLRTHSALGRINDDEARHVFEKLEEAGYVVTKKADNA